MDTFVFFLTIFVMTALLVRWPVWRLVAWSARRSGLLEDVDLGLARVRLPSGWRPARFLNDQASLQAIHPVKGRYLIVISESLEDFVDADLDVAEYSAHTIGTLTNGFRVLACSDAKDRQVGSFRARQVELEAICDGALITFLHSTIKGTRAVHQVIGWAPRSKYSRPVFDSLVDGFVELPGPPPEPFRGASDSQEAPPPSSRGAGGHIGF